MQDTDMRTEQSDRNIIIEPLREPWFVTYNRAERRRLHVYHRYTRVNGVHVNA